MKRSPMRGVLEPLRNQAGPARPISAQDAEFLIQLTLDRAEGFAPPPVVRVPRVRRSWRAISLAILAIGSVAAAGTKIVTSHLEIGPVRIIEHAPKRQAASRPVIEELTKREVPRAAEKARSGRDLLVEANQLRHRKQWSRAERQYATIVKTFPGSDEAYAASIAAAELRLEHLDDAEGALELYQDAWRTHRDGPLAEEALYGLAGAYRALGRWRAEQRTLGTFQRKFPQSTMHEQVDQRLDQLDEMLP
jgi:tetratricopeptide (TPR) repeat protein